MKLFLIPYKLSVLVVTSISFNVVRSHPILDLRLT